MKGRIDRSAQAESFLVLDSRVVDELARPIEFVNGEVRIPHSADPALIVADGVPRVLLGDMGDGKVTLIDSYLHHPSIRGFQFESIFRQYWRPQAAIFGEHYPDGYATPVAGVRAVLGDAVWWSHLFVDGEKEVRQGDVSCRRDADDEVWIEYRPESGLSVRLADRFAQSLSTLMKLSVDVDLDLRRMQVLDANEVQWLEVVHPCREPVAKSYPSPLNFLDRSYVTVERIAEWVENEKCMDGLSSAIAYPVKGEAMEVRCLVAGSLLEGIHKRIVNAGQVNYADRASEMLRIAKSVDDGIVDPVADWPQLVKRSRHDLAHHNPRVTYEVQIYEWMIAELSILWVLRISLLLSTGFSKSQISESLDRYRAYQFYRENLKMHVMERDSNVR